MGGFRISEFPPKAYQALLTALHSLPKQGLVMIPELVELAKAFPGCLIIDDTSNPKYGLKDEGRSLYNPATRGFGHGYKLLLFLWHCEAGYIPLGFALWHKGSASLTELALSGFSVLRNHYRLKPLSVLADGYFSTRKLLKRLDDYGWMFVMRCKKNRKLSNVAVRCRIARGYGETTGTLDNGLKVKVIRDRKHFLVTNRKLLSRQAIQAFYKLRWAIEETFRFLKTALKPCPRPRSGINSCQQHSMRAQASFVGLCLLAPAFARAGLLQTCKGIGGIYPIEPYTESISRVPIPKNHFIQCFAALIEVQLNSTSLLF